MKIIAYALLATVLIILFAAIEVLVHGLFRIACLVGLIFLAMAMFHQINK